MFSALKSGNNVNYAFPWRCLEQGQAMLEENGHASGKRVGLHGWGVGQTREGARKVNTCTIYQENV